MCVYFVCLCSEFFLGIYFQSKSHVQRNCIYTLCIHSTYTHSHIHVQSLHEFPWCIKLIHTQLISISFGKCVYMRKLILVLRKKIEEFVVVLRLSFIYDGAHTENMTIHCTVHCCYVRCVCVHVRTPYRERFEACN